MKIIDLKNLLGELGVPIEEFDNLTIGEIIDFDDNNVSHIVYVSSDSNGDISGMWLTQRRKHE